MTLLLICDYLFHRKQRTEIGSSYGSWHGKIRGIPQGSLLGNLRLFIFVNDFFFYLSESLELLIVQVTLYSVGKNIEYVISDLKTDRVGVMEWFKINSLKASRGKCRFMVLRNKDQRSFNIHINNVKIKKSKEIALLEIKIDKNLTFKKHISEL